MAGPLGQLIAVLGIDARQVDEGISTAERAVEGFSQLKPEVALGADAGELQGEVASAETAVEQFGDTTAEATLEADESGVEGNVAQAAAVVDDFGELNPEAVLGADGGDVQSTVGDAVSELSAFDGTEAEALLAADGSVVEGEVANAARALDDFAGTEAEAALGADASGAEAAIGDAVAAMEAFDGTDAQAALTADDSDVQATVADAVAEVQAFDGEEATAALALDDEVLMAGLKAADAELRKLTAEEKRLVRLGIDSGPLIDELRRARAEIEQTAQQMAGLERRADTTSGGFGRFGNAAKVGFGVASVAVAGGFALMAKGADEMETAQGRFQAATGQSAEAAKAFAQDMNSIVGTAATTGRSFEEISAAGIQIAQQFKITGEAGKALTEDFLAFSKVTRQDAAAAVDDFDAALDAWGEPAERATGLMDQLIASNQKYGTVAGPEALQALQNMAPALKAMNLGIDDGIGLMNLFEAAGLDASKAPMALQRAISQLKPGQNLNDLISQITSIEDPTLRAQKAMEIFGTRGGAGLANALKPGITSLDEFIITQESAVGASGKASDALVNTSDKVKMFFERTMAGLRGLGAEFGPLVSGFGAIVTGLGPLIAKAGPGVVRAMSGLATGATTALLGGLQGLGQRLGGILEGAWSAAGSAASRVAAAAAGLATRAYQAALRIGSAIGNVLTAAWDAARGLASRAVTAAGAVAGGLYAGALRVASVVGDAIGSAWSAVRGVTSRVIAAAGAAAGAVYSGAVAVVGTLSSALSAMWGRVGTAGRAAILAAGTIAGGLYSGAVTAASQVVAALQGMWQRIAASPALKIAIGAAGAAAGLVYSAAVAVVGPLVAALAGAWAAMRVRTLPVAVAAGVADGTAYAGGLAAGTRTSMAALAALGFVFPAGVQEKINKQATTAGSAAGARFGTAMVAGIAAAVVGGIIVINEALNEVERRIKEARTVLAQPIDPVSPETIARLREMGGQLEHIANVARIPFGWHSATGELRELSQELKTAGSYATTFGRGMAQAADAIRQHYLTATDQVKEALRSLGPQYRLTEADTRALAARFNVSTGVIIGAAAKVEQEWRETGSRIRSHLGDLGSEFTGTAEQFAQAAELLGVPAEEVERVWREMGGAVADVGGQVTDVAGEVATATEAIANALRQMGPGFALTNTEVSALADRFGVSFGTIAQVARDVTIEFGEHTQRIRDFLTQQGAGFATSEQDVQRWASVLGVEAGQVQGVLDGMLGPALERIRGAVGEAFEIGSAVPGEIGRGMVAESREIVTAADHLKWVLENGLTDEERRNFAVGKNHIKDFWEGIRSEIPGAREAAFAVGVESLDALASSNLDNKKNSKAVGEYMAGLYADGWTDSQIMVGLASAGVGREALLKLGEVTGWDAAAIDQAIAWAQALGGPESLAAAETNAGDLRSGALTTVGDPTGFAAAAGAQVGAYVGALDAPEAARTGARGTRNGALEGLGDTAGFGAAAGAQVGAYVGALDAPGEARTGAQGTRSGALEGLGGTAGFDSAGASQREAYTSEVGKTQPAVAAGEGLSGAVEGALKTTLGFRAAGRIASAAYEQGLIDGAQGVHRAGTVLAGAGVAGIRTGGPGFTGAGNAQGALYASGISAQHGRAASAGRNLANAAASATRGIPWFTYGANSAQAWVNGFTSRIRSARTQLASALRTFSGPLRGFSAPREGPLRDIERWGANIGEAWGEGLARALDEINVRGPLSRLAGSLAQTFDGPRLAAAAAVPAPLTDVARVTSRGGDTLVVNIYGNVYGPGGTDQLIRDIETRTRFKRRGSVLD